MSKYPRPTDECPTCHRQISINSYGQLRPHDIRKGEPCRGDPAYGAHINGQWIKPGEAGNDISTT